MHNDGAGSSSVTLIHLPGKKDKTMYCHMFNTVEYRKRGMREYGGRRGAAMDLLLQPHQSVIIFVTMQLDPDY